MMQKRTLLKRIITLQLKEIKKQLYKNNKYSSFLFSIKTLGN